MDQETVSPQPRMNVAELTAFLDAAFPMHARRSLGEVVSITPERLRMRLDPTPGMARPGNIVSGPTLMALADCAAYLVIAAFNGPEAMAVTNALSISFLRACRFELIFVDARLLKLGRRLASAEIRIWQRSEDRLIAHATVGYALP